ncbi:hypothetical protein [Mycolicibacterium senegalense]|uniref:Uncharacterized protein n=1 Tax=Mycolicibacterium senegalense TaxID=1796 RepID=A0ABR5G1J5_9MYCO|nr:hypothetical protein [Mycolicibacterium senegalense]KLI05774.1 hypothetical protein AA982_22695 [Mycolicibacterium senegalense]KLO54058.1 hypothetical protein ABW05_23865 [Mycolicibacterium senegalense]KLO54124.1 hypothetical protein ABW05_24305 [Mycolicibacterium senegalense]
MAAGERPENVRIVDKETGEATPCELAYVGVDENGVGVWEVSEHNPFDPARHMVRVGRLPGKTAIMFPTRPGAGGKG